MVSGNRKGTYDAASPTEFGDTDEDGLLRVVLLDAHSGQLVSVQPWQIAALDGCGLKRSAVRDHVH